jgi:hypothetical protein
MLALGGCVSLHGEVIPIDPTATDGALGVAVSTPHATADARPTPGPTARATRRPTLIAAATSALMPAPTPTATPALTPTVTPEPTATPRPTPRLRPRPRKGPFRLDLYRRGDFVSEFTAWYCLPAALQTMINIMEPGRPDRTRRTQDRLYRLARRFSTDKLEGKGAEPIGWARALEHLGYGEWKVAAYRTRGQAVKAAAKALRMTGRPVGMLTWRGAHSWVMSGFRASADPALTNRYQVTSIAIQDVWYPRVSSIWGASDPPDTWLRVEDLGRDFLRYNRWTVKYPGLDGRYVVVLPVPEDPAA